MKKIINIILLFITFILPPVVRADMFMRAELSGMPVITPSNITANINLTYPQIGISRLWASALEPFITNNENPNIKICRNTAILGTMEWIGWHGPQSLDGCNGCGSHGLNNNQDGTTKPPCLIMVDVNGDRKPNPNNVNCKSQKCADENKHKYSDPTGLKLTDLFTIMITDKEAIPYGVAAQRAMYQAQAKK